MIGFMNKIELAFLRRCAFDTLIFCGEMNDRIAPGWLHESGKSNYYWKFIGEVPLSRWNGHTKRMILNLSHLAR